MLIILSQDLLGRFICIIAIYTMREMEMERHLCLPRFLCSYVIMHIAECLGTMARESLMYPMEE